MNSDCETACSGAVWSGPVIGVVQTPFAEKFGAPRQAGVVPAAEGWVRLHPPYDRQEALVGLEQCSHLWLLYGFNRVSAATEASLTVRPPRLGGNRRLGVFATRSPFRPHPVGLSAVRLLAVHPGRAGRSPHPGHLHVAGVDLVDGTPLLDIKPYLPWADALKDARCGWADDRPTGLVDLPLRFSDAAKRELEACEKFHSGFRVLLQQTLCADPRPSYQNHQDGRDYGMALAGIHVRWRVYSEAILVLELAAGEAGPRIVSGASDRAAACELRPAAGPRERKAGS